MEVQRGQAIALLMQGQRQQQAALQFGKVDELADQTRAIGFSQFLGECGDYDCLP
jgi:hypothetical protein